MHYRVIANRHICIGREGGREVLSISYYIDCSRSKTNVLYLVLENRHICKGREGGRGDEDVGRTYLLVIISIVLGARRTCTTWCSS